MFEGFEGKQCPVCHGAVEVVADETGERFEHRIIVGEVFMALASEAVAREVAALLDAGQKMALASVLLETHGGPDPFFTPQDVRDEAEAAARCDGIVRELRARRQFDEAAGWAVTAKRHRTRAGRIALLLSDADKAIVHQQIHGGPLSDPPRSPIEVVSS